MRGVRIGVCLLIGLLLVMPIVLASTEINIKTMPYRQVSVGALSSGQSLGILSGQANEYGDIKFIFDFTATKYDLITRIKEEDKTIKTDKQLALVGGDSQYFEIATSDFVFIETPAGKEDTNIIDKNSGVEEVVTNTTSSNETVVNVTSPDITPIINEVEKPEPEKTNESEEDVPKETIETNETESYNLVSRMAGAVVSTVKNNKTTILYSLGGVIVIGGMILFLIRRRGSKEIKITKLSDKISKNVSRQTILDVESKLKGIQDELDGMKG